MRKNNELRDETKLCRRCNQELPLSEFATRTRVGRSGMPSFHPASYCRKCDSEGRRRRYLEVRQLRPKAKPPTQEGMKFCRRCDKEFPLSAFGTRKRGTRTGGVREYYISYCRSCASEIQMLRYPDNKDAIKHRMRAYYMNSRREQIKKKAKETGLCYWCAEPAEPGKTRCAEHRAIAQAANRRRSRVYWQKLQDECLAAYGRSCVCCGESNPRFLTFDHPDGNGKAHRQEAKQAGFNGIKPMLKSQGFPPGAVRTMCYNCNCAREFNEGICPHEEERKLLPPVELMAC